MRHHLLFWLILIGIGALIGHRYGMPGFVTGVTDPAFESVERMLGRERGDAEEYEDFYKDFDVDEAAEETSGEDDDASEPQQYSEPAPVTGPASADLGHADNAGLRINDAGLTIIKESEGLRLEAYQLGGQWLIFNNDHFIFHA